MTKREMYTAIRELVIENTEMVEFIDHEIILLERKSSTPRKPTKTQEENSVYKSDILDALASADAPVSIKELINICPAVAELSNQRITHLLTNLREEGKVVRTYIKRVAYFALGNEAENDTAE